MRGGSRELAKGSGGTGTSSAYGTTTRRLGPLGSAERMPSESFIPDPFRNPMMSGMTAAGSSRARSVPQQTTDGIGHSSARRASACSCARKAYIFGKPVDSCVGTGPRDTQSPTFGLASPKSMIPAVAPIPRASGSNGSSTVAIHSFSVAAGV